MFRNIFKITIRNLIKFKVYTFINLLGLAAGIGGCILILLFVNDELSYDKHNKKWERIYRLYELGKLGDNELRMAVSAAPVGEAMQREFPEVESYTRIAPTQNMLIRYEDKTFVENRFIWADSTIFNVFTIPLIKGKIRTALNEPHTVVLTKSAAEKYFGEENPIDKILKFEDGTPYRVTAVAEDCKPNAHFHYDIIASMSSLEGSRGTFWLSNNFYTYLLLKDGFKGERLQEKFPELVKKYIGPQLQGAMGVTYDSFIAGGNYYNMYLQPLSDIHLKSHLDYEMEPNGDISYIYIFSAAALFILLIACINFMNLATARSSMRAKEVGLRKVMGSNSSQLVAQFLTEAVLLTILAVGIALIAVELSLPFFNSVTGKELETAYMSWEVLPLFLGGILFVGLLAGSYPAFFLSSFQPAAVLKGKLKTGSKSGLLRSGLVVFQFTISIILLISTIIVFNQLDYVQNKNLGFNKEKVFVIKRAWALEGNRESYKEELLQNSSVVSAAGATSLPGTPLGQTVYQAADAGAGEKITSMVMAADHNYAKTLNLQLKEGRFFSKEMISDSSAVIINESAAKTFGYKEPLGKDILLAGPTPEQSRRFTIIGVLKDYHFESLHQSIRPLCIHLNNEINPMIAVRLQGEKIRATIDFMEKKWKSFVPDKPFEYYFLDEEYDKLYSSELRTGRVFTSFSILAVLIACLGLFGLAAFTTEQKTKEIGIRKTLGATNTGIVVLLSKEFGKWVLLANLIAWPAGYYIMNNWLNDFAYRIDLTLWAFLYAGTAAFIIALITVSYQALKAAWANPVNSLKYE